MPVDPIRNRRRQDHERDEDSTVLPSAPPARPPCIVFLHIPKAAGQTLNAILARQYDESATVIVADPSNLERSFARVAHQRPVALVRGHVPYGIHERLGIDALYITMLREPVARVASMYEYIKRSPQHRLHDVVRAEEMTLSRFVASDINREEVVDGQTRVLSGMLDGNPDELTLGAALNNLERIAVVGLSERFDESILLMRRRFGWKMPLYVRKNVAPRPSLDDVNRRDREVIERRNELDIELYRAATVLLDNRVGSAGARFRLEFIGFQTLNRLASGYVALSKRRSDG